MLVHFFGEQVGIDTGMHGHERLAETGREGGLWLLHADFGTGHLGGVAGDEVVSSLRGRQAGDGWEHPKGIAGQEDDVLRVTALGIGRSVVDEFDGVGAACVLRLRGVVEVGNTLAVKDDVFEHRAVLAGGGEDGGFIFF